MVMDNGFIISGKPKRRNLIAGMDEAGRGPAIGPIVFGLVLLNKNQEEKLKKYGINDSKKLSPKKRLEMEKIIKENSSAWGVYVISAQNIDSKRNEITLNEIEIDGFRKLLAKFKQYISRLQIDAADVNESRFQSRFTDMIKNVDAKHKGDSLFISVGAASILAKVERDRRIEQIQQIVREKYPDLPPIGSGYPNKITKQFLRAYYIKYNKLPDFARKSWKTCKEIINNRYYSLDDYM